MTTWKDKEPIWNPVETHARISGVADTTQHTSYEGQIYEFEVEDAFFFSAKATTEMREQAGLTNEPDFTIRPTSPEAMIEIKDELSAQGIVPLGNFELVENTVRLQDKTQSQSATASATVVTAANALGLAVFAGLAWNRRRETAIMRICGCSKSDTFASISIEGAVIVVASMLLAGICGLVAAGEPALWIIIAASSGITAYLLQIAVATLSNPFTVLKRARR